MTKKTQAAISVKLITDGATLGKAIASLANRGKKLQNDLHIAAVSVLAHVDKHGDITLANRLLEAVPGFGRKMALRDWFLAYGRLSFDETKKQFIFARDKSTIMHEIDPETGKDTGAMATPFWVFSPEKETPVFDLQAAIARLLVQAEKALQKGNAKVNAEQLQALRGVAKVSKAHAGL